MGQPKKNGWRPSKIVGKPSGVLHQFAGLSLEREGVEFWSSRALRGYYDDTADKVDEVAGVFWCWGPGSQVQWLPEDSGY